MGRNDPPSLPAMLLVDDHAIVREGLRRVLEPLSREWQLLEATHGFEALDLMRQGDITLVITDLSMPGMTGLDLVRRIKVLYPQVHTLVLSMHDEHQYAKRAFKAGANGYVTKDTAANELVAAVHKVLAGGTYVSSVIAERMVQELGGRAPANTVDGLSDRELEVLTRLTAGQRQTDIADALHLSIKTVSTHKSRILEKLGLSSTAALVRFGLENGLDKADSGFTHLETSSPPPSIPRK